tara:strand:+ start:41689 stop:42372 length:684 start_codon:yes stop_codon:yes gene_type:complete
MAKRSSKNVLTVPKFLKDLTTNKYVLYIVAFIAALNVLGYMAAGKNICVLLFILIAAITSYFSKNMVFVLAVPTFLVGFFVICDSMKSVKEGATFDTKSKSDDDDDDEDNDDDNDDDTGNDNGDDDDDEEVKPNEKDGYRNSGRKGDRIDYATTLEDAYTNLNNMVGKDGIKALTRDTKALMKQQVELANAMKGMQPLIGQAKEMMNSLGEFGDLNKMANDLGINKK